MTDTQKDCSIEDSELDELIALIDNPDECCGCHHNSVDYRDGEVIGRYCDKPGTCQYKRWAFDAGGWV